MALIASVGASDADSYVTLFEYEAYAEKLGWALSGVAATDEASLRRAAQILDREYHWRGIRDLEDQALAWPRENVGYVDGWLVDDYIIPQDIKDAQCELAYLIQEGLDPVATITGVVKSAGAGPARVEFLGGQGKPRLVAIEGLLRPYLASGPGQSKMMRG